MNPEKPRRAYNSTRRQEQSRETRRRIIEAARHLFIERGYAGATLDSIAEEAGVAVETVFAMFGNKRSLLAELISVSVGGDDRPIPLLERPGPQNVMRETDPARQLLLFAQDISKILERVYPLFDVMRAAAKTEPDIAELLERVLGNRLRNLGVFVHNLAAHTPLREGMGEGLATETVWAMTSPEVFRLLTADRDWSQERYAEWLADALKRLLLDS